jgi:hypothetical protein
MADEFIYFLVGGLAIMAALLVVGLGIGYAPSTGLASLGSYYTGSPIFVGVADTDSVETLYARFDANNYIQTKAYNVGARKIDNGLLFGSSSIKVDTNSAGFISASFDVRSTNRYGNIVIKIDDKVIVNQMFDEGHYELPLGSGRTVEISSESSEWKIWAPAVYDLENVVISASSYPRDKSTYTFEVFNKSDIQSVRVDFFLDSNAGAMMMKLNGDVVYDGALNNQQTIYLDPGRLDSVNILTFDAREDSSFSGRATIAITRKTTEPRDLVIPINMTGDEYNRFARGVISFDVIDVYRPGGYSVTIVNNGLVLQQEYVKLEKGFFVLDLEKNSLKPGLNTIIVRPADNAAFTVQNINTRL